MINAHLIRYINISFIILLLVLSFNTQAKRSEYHIAIKNHLFEPAKIIIPANKKVKLIIYNHDENVEEFDSFDLNREKVIFPNHQAIIFIGPLPVGEYNFFGEYHPHSARGKVVVSDASNSTSIKKVNKGGIKVIEKGGQNAN